METYVQHLSFITTPDFQREVAQVRARAALTALSREPSTVAWTYHLPRLLRNATAALIDVEAAIHLSGDPSADLASKSRRLGQLWESVARITTGDVSSIARVNAILAYELAGYQANSVCLSRELAAGQNRGEVSELTALIASFFRRQFHQAIRTGDAVLNLTPEAEMDTTELLNLAAQGLVAGAVVEASRYFLTGEATRIARSLEMLNAASKNFASLGAAAHHSLVRLLSQALPRMQGRSTWQLLGPIHGADEMWSRYLTLLARGLGPRIDENSGIVELWPSQRTALEQGLFDADSSTMVRMPTSAGKTRIAEMAIVDHLISFPGSRCLYIAPFKALASEVEGVLSSLILDLGFRLSTTTGNFETDYAQHELLESADVIVTTPERIDLLLRTDRQFFDSVGLVVIDEGQLVEDKSRGPRFEILLSRIRLGWPKIRFISLSAVIPRSSLEDMAAWLGSGTAGISESDWRPAVQRHASFAWQGHRGFIRFLPDPEDPGIEGFLPYVTEVHTFAFVNPVTGRVNRRRFPDVLVKAQTAAELAYTLAPTGAVLVFCPTPGLADTVSDALMNRIQHTRQAEEPVPYEFTDRTNRSVAICSDWLGEEHSLTRKLRSGVAVHHGRVPDAVRQAIERDFRERRFQVIVATSTLAQGVNLPIKTVIIHSAHRRIGEANVPLSAREYWNIAGRAGRAGEETEGLIVHICNTENDTRLVRYYASRKSSLERVESALLDDLLRLAQGRITNEDSLQYLESDLLALLVEENVTEVTEEWVEGIFQRTLAAIEARRRDSDSEDAKNALRILLEQVLQQVPDYDQRTAFSSTGLCVNSCKAMVAKILDQEDVLRGLITGATLSDRRQLIDVLLEGAFAAVEIAPDSDPLFEVAELAERWLSGEDYDNIRASFSSPDGSPLSLSAFVEDMFGYRLPWGVSAYLRLALKVLQIDEEAQSTFVRYFPSMLKYGVPTPFAVWCIAAGVGYRSVAIRMGQVYARQEPTPNLSAFFEWASRWTIEGLHSEFGLSGSVLDDVASALQKATPSPLIRQSASADFSIFPLKTGVLVAANLALLTAESLNDGDIVELERDYDMAYNRNAVRCTFGGEYLGLVEHDVAQLIAPLMDTGSRYHGIVEGLDTLGFMKRLNLSVRPIAEA